MFQLLMLFLFPLLTSSPQPYTIDFGTQGNQKGWRVINDGVMGGLSEGRARLTESSVLLRGIISLENNGGFSSLKGPFGRYDLSQYQTVEIRMRHTGIGFAMTLEQHQRFYMPYYKHALETRTDRWETLRLPLSGFKRYQMGRTDGQSIDADALANTLRIGFISFEKRAGDFEIEIDYIRFN